MPDTIADLCEAVEKSDSQSSLFQKADAALRAKLVEALIRKDPWTYHDCFQHFELDRLGISFTAFYYWARRVRRSAALIEMARSCDAEHNPVELVPKVLAFRLLDASLDDDAGLTALNRLTRIYQAASNVEIARRRMDIASQKADASKTRAESGDLLRLCKIATDLQRKNLRAETAELAEQTKFSEDDPPARGSEPLPQVEDPPRRGSAERPSNATDLTPPRETRTVDSSSVISNLEISNSPAPEIRNLVDLVPSVPLVPAVPSSPPVPHSDFPLPHSPTIRNPQGVHPPRREIRNRVSLANPVRSLPDPLAPRIDLDDLPDPDPRREALRQRIRDDLKPLLNFPDSS